MRCGAAGVPTRDDTDGFPSDETYSSIVPERISSLRQQIHSVGEAEARAVNEIFFEWHELKAEYGLDIISTGSGIRGVVTVGVACDDAATADTGAMQRLEHDLQARFGREAVVVERQHRAEAAMDGASR